MTSLALAQKQVLDDLHEGLQQALSDLRPEQYGGTLYLAQKDSDEASASTRSFRLEGPEEVSIEVHCTVPRLGDSAHDIRVEIRDGPTQHFRYNPSGEPPDVGGPAQLGHTVAAFLLDEMERELGHALFQQSSRMGAALQVPMLSLDQEGTIQHVTEAARRVLEYSSGTSLDSCFFTHVHGDNLRRVMRDLAHMVCHSMKYSQWLLRMRTGNSRWRWYRAKVRNHLEGPNGFIQVRLHPL